LRLCGAKFQQAVLLIYLLDVCIEARNADVCENLELYSVIKVVCRNYVVIMGDFNYPGINWQTLDCDASSVNFLEIVQDTFLVQHVLSPTRGDNVLDLVLSSEEGMIKELEVFGTFFQW